MEGSTWEIYNLSSMGDIASLVGVVIALVGFVITIKAANQAARAANRTLERVRYVDIVQNLSTAISIIEEIQRLNRAGEWKVLLDRHLAFRKIMTEVKGSRGELNDEHRAVIQQGITHSNSMSNTIETALELNDQLPNVRRMNNILSKQVEKLGDILVEMRMETDG